MTKSSSALLKKYRLSADAFRRRFRSSEKKPEESFSKFAYSLKTTMVDWLKGQEALGYHNEVTECIGLELFYNGLSGETRRWVRFPSLQRVAYIAEEFASRREAEKSPSLAKNGTAKV